MHTTYLRTKFKSSLIISQCLHSFFRSFQIFSNYVYSLGPILSQLSVNIGWSVLLTAALSFAGAGVAAPTPEWGSMIAIGFQNVVTGQWWPSIFPGIFLGLTVFSFALMGASIEVLADPVRRVPSS